MATLSSAFMVLSSMVDLVIAASKGAGLTIYVICTFLKLATFGVVSDYDLVNTYFESISRV